MLKEKADKVGAPVHSEGASSSGAASSASSTAVLSSSRDAAPPAAAASTRGVRRKSDSPNSPVGKFAVFLAALTAMLGDVVEDVDSDVDDSRPMVAPRPAVPGAHRPGGESSQQLRTTLHDDVIQPTELFDDDVPSMPCIRAELQRHRPKMLPSFYNACVARPVHPREAKTNAKALAAMQSEWDRLRTVPRKDSKRGCWDEDKVQ